MNKKIDLNSFVKMSKDINNSKFIEEIKNAYVKVVADVIHNTIIDVGESDMTIEQVKEDTGHKWLTVALNSVFEASKAFNNASEIGLIIDGDGFVTEFEQNTKVKIRLINEEYVGQDIIETEIILDTGKSEKLYEILNKAFYGGEVYKPSTEGDEGETLVFNARKGYHQPALDKASKQLQEYFMNENKKEIEKKLSSEIIDKFEKLFK